MLHCWRNLLDQGGGADAKILRVAALSLVYFRAEYCTPVWCHSVHVSLIDSVLNNALCIVTGCLHSTSKDNLSIFACIQLAELRQLGATLSLAYHSTMDPDHMLHNFMVRQPSAQQERLQSRHPFVPAARKLLGD